jgi:hypothetical protein
MNSSTNRLHFPAKIYLILENESPEIIRWHANNKAFRINDHQRFEREIIPKYFRRKFHLKKIVTTSNSSNNVLMM